MHRFVKHQLLLIVASVCIGACAHVSPSLVVPEPTSYTVPRPSETKFVFEDYLAYARELAARWDEHAKLESIARQTRCDANELTANQSLRASFWHPIQFWFGQRIEWFEVIDLPEYAEMQIAVSTSGNSTWDKPSVEFESVAISYSEALEKSLERGGAEFMTAHPTCYLAVSLHAGQWRFVYSLDRWQAQGEPLKLCVDSRIGEPCEFPNEQGWLEQQP